MWWSHHHHLISSKIRNKHWSFIYNVYFNEIVYCLNGPVSSVCNTHVGAFLDIFRSIKNPTTKYVCVLCSVSCVLLRHILRSTIFAHAFTLGQLSARKWRVLTQCKQQNIITILAAAACMCWNVNCVTTEEWRVRDYYCVTEYLLINGSRYRWCDARTHTHTFTQKTLITYHFRRFIIICHPAVVWAAAQGQITSWSTLNKS